LIAEERVGFGRREAAFFVARDGVLGRGGGGKFVNPVKITCGKTY